MEEKRRFIRIEVPVIVNYQPKDPHRTKKKSIAKDFSEGGIRFRVYENLKIGSLLELNIESPFDTMPISIQGQVVWIRSLNIKTERREIYEIGVQFIHLHAYDRQRLKHTIKSFLSATIAA